MKRKLLLLSVVMLSGCAYQVTLMPRDSGKTYSGTLEGSGPSGTMTVNIEGDVCTGPAAKVASNETFGFSTTYARTNSGAWATGNAQTYTSGDSAVKVIMSCKSGRGLRCDMTGRGASGGGICVDDQGKVYDALAIRK